jgi:hypothetical protein
MPFLLLIAEEGRFIEDLVFTFLRPDSQVPHFATCFCRFHDIYSFHMVQKMS